MKSLHCVYSGNRFADQYTLDLEGFMSPHEFTATINTFNTAAWHYPPPNRMGSGSLNYYLFCLSSVILVAVIIAIHYTHQIGFVLVLPFSFLAVSMIIVYWRRRKMIRFESAMIHLCSCMNATENAITIEFDDRYNLLHHFSNSAIANRNQLPSYQSTCITISPPMYEIDKPTSTYYPNEKSIV
ncbi:hypothetical protein INT48_000531 [Thamnidium elegans]|uniref:Uncharacterized protein n=1 Tax=Thamnidium elegans TaxID=101142 RepID=A0A8H7SVG4_9FUNG|nr:hypothetical protein INT48_000531 [Thamnidium elegans]